MTAFDVDLALDSPPRRLRPLALVALVASAVASFAALAHYYSPQLGDDGFIYFRYARNLVRGYGPVWNAGERVEGFSSPLWLGLVAAGQLLGFAPVVFVRVIGIGFAGAAAAGSYVLARRLGATMLGAVFTLVASSLLLPLHYWASSGLETPLVAALMVWGSVAFTRDSRIGYVGILGLVGIARPEGIGIAAVALAALAVAHGPTGFERKRIALCLGPALVWLVFRLSYFHVPLPNTYYAKATGPLVDRLSLGLTYATGIVPSMAVVTFLARPAIKTANGRAIAATVLVTGVMVAIEIIGGGDWMWNARLFAPVLPVILAIGAAEVSALSTKADASRPIVELLIAALIVAPYIPPFEALARAFAFRRISPTGRQEGTMTDASQAAAAWIRAHYPADTLVAVNHAGALPYYLDWPCLDMVGLANIHIARDIAGGLHRKFDPAYVVSRDPGVVVLNTRVAPGTNGVFYHPGYWDGETALVSYEPFRRRYRPVSTFWTWQSATGATSYIVLFERTPAAQ